MTRKLLMAATVLALLAAPGGPAAAQPVSGLYIGAGGGANFMEHERNKSITPRGGAQRPLFGQSDRDVGVVGVGSVGYGFGNGLRLELEGDYRYNRIARNPAAAGAVSSGGREQKYGAMVNVLFDLDVGSPYIYPYLGGGLGYNWVDRRRTTTGTLSFPTAGGGTGTRVGAINLESGVDSSLAYQVIAGLSFPVPPVVGLSLTAEYRYFALAGDRSYGSSVIAPGLASSSRIKVTGDYNHSLMLGLRYAFNVAPPPVAVPEAVPAAPVQASRTYLVFFDWDRADLTTRARQIVAEAAQATTRVQVTRIEVAGHTDTTGSAGYNQGLSIRRAQTVAAELVRLGVPRGAITTEGFGFTRPLVATGPGVREPQNRRVEIVLR